MRSYAREPLAARRPGIGRRRGHSATIPNRDAAVGPSLGGILAEPICGLRPTDALCHAVDVDDEPERRQRDRDVDDDAEQRERVLQDEADHDQDGDEKQRAGDQRRDVRLRERREQFEILLLFRLGLLLIQVVLIAEECRDRLTGAKHRRQVLGEVAQILAGRPAGGSLKRGQCVGAERVHVTHRDRQLRRGLAVHVLVLREGVHHAGNAIPDRESAYMNATVRGRVASISAARACARWFNTSHRP